MGVALERVQFGGGGVAEQGACVDGRVGGAGRARGGVDVALHPVAVFHEFQGLRQGPVGDGGQAAFDGAELARAVQGGEDRHCP